MARAFGNLRLFWLRGLRQIWGKPGMGAGPPWLRIVRTLLLTVICFRRNHLTIHASGLTFFLLLTVVPFLAFALGVLRVFRVAELLRPYLLAFVAGGNLALVPRIDEYIANAQSGMVGSLGVLLTLGVGLLLLQRVRTALNVIWEVPPDWVGRSRVIEFIAVLTLTPILLAAAFGITGLVGSSMVLDYIPGWIVESLPAIPLSNLVGFGLVLLVTYYSYRYLPEGRVEVRPALLGASVAALGIVLVQNFYVVLILLASRQSPIYGALAVLPFLMLWFYLAWLVFLSGAQLAFVTQHYERELELRRAGDSALSHQPYLALLVLAALLRKLSATGKGVRRQELARTLRLPNDSVHDVLGRLVRAGLVTPVQGDRSRYVPQEVLDHLTVAEVLQRAELQPGFPDVPLWHGHRMGHPILSLFREANRGLLAPLTGVTLRGLADRLEAADRAAAAPDQAAS